MARWWVQISTKTAQGSKLNYQLTIPPLLEPLGPPLFAMTIKIVTQGNQFHVVEFCVLSVKI